jgi:hypothetical protein
VLDPQFIDESTLGYNALMPAITIDEIDTSWLSRAMALPVQRFSIDPVNAGYTSDVYRILFDEPELPPSIILKLAAASEDSAQFATRFHAAEKETRFYSDYSTHVSVRTPACYFCDAEHFALLLEDFSHWPVTRPETGASQNQTILAMETLAQLHGQTPIVNPAPFIESLITASEDMNTFVMDRLEDLADTPAVLLMKHYAGNSLAISDKFTELPQVFSHMDFRLDNLRFREDEVTVFDWGEYSLAPVGFDMAYFMTTSLTTSNRRKWEEQMLAVHLDALHKHGLDKITRAQLFNSYRLALLPGFYLPALVLTRGDPRQGKQLLEQSLSAITDHIEWLESLFTRD